MNVHFKASFAKDLRNISKTYILKRTQAVIKQVEHAQNLQEINNLKKLKMGHIYYRIRVSDYRLGLLIKDNIVTFVRCLHRKDFYRYFP